MGAVFLAAIGFGAVVLTAGATLAFCPSRSETAIWLYIGIPYVIVLIAGSLVTMVGFRDPHSGLSYINVDLGFLIMGYFASGASVAAVILRLSVKRK